MEPTKLHFTDVFQCWFQINPRRFLRLYNIINWWHSFSFNTRKREQQIESCRSIRAGVCPCVRATAHSGWVCVSLSLWHLLAPSWSLLLLQQPDSCTHRCAAIYRLLCCQSLHFSHSSAVISSGQWLINNLQKSDMWSRV